jgi:hypothetical protein
MKQVGSSEKLRRSLRRARREGSHGEARQFGRQLTQLTRKVG